MALNRYETEDFGVVLTGCANGYEVEMYDIENREEDPFMILRFDSLILAMLAYDEIIQEV